MSNDLTDKTIEREKRHKAFGIALHKMLEVFTLCYEDTFEDIMSSGIKPVADVIDANYVLIYHFVDTGENKCFKQIYRWGRIEGGGISLDENLRALSVGDHPALDKWLTALIKDECVNITLNNMSDDEQDFFSTYNVRSALLVPIFMYGRLWGVVSFQDYTDEWHLDENSIVFLRSAARLCAKTIIGAQAERTSYEALKTLKHRERMIAKLNETAIKFLSQSEETFEDMMTIGASMIVDMVNLDNLSVWINFTTPDGLRTSQVYRWDKEVGGTTDPIDALTNIPYVPCFKEILSVGGTINGPASLLPETDLLKSFGIVSIFATPVFIDSIFWGFVLFGDTQQERTFTDDETDILRSASLMMANALNRNSVIKKNEERDKLLKAALKDAWQANRAKSEFLASMSHEIRTPMNVILGITEIQIQKNELAPDIKESFNKIYNSGNHLLGIINDILDMSKIEAGKLELVSSKYEMASLINDAIQLNIIRVADKQIKFELYVDENIPAELLGDELRIKQILNNLLSNAFKYTAEGVIKFSVSSEDVENEKVMLVFTVSDTGYGMTEDQLSKIFDEYSRFDNKANRIIEGTGLGMTITQSLVNMMNGEIFVESEINKGTTFTVRLPQEKIGSDILGEKIVESLQQFRGEDSTQKKRTRITREPMPYGSVLIVDDVEMNIFVTKGLLAPYELSVDSVMSGFEAIDKIKEGKVYDIIFMDHMMPKMDGMAATKIIRDLGYTNPIVALTANAVVGQSEIFLKNGFDDFIAKPIDVGEMNFVLNKHVRDKHLSK